MKRAFTFAFILFISISAAMASDDDKGTPYNLGSNKHLFLDEFLIGEKSGVDLVVNPPAIKELVLIADKPWERGGITSYCNVLRDEKLGEYRLYYVPVHLESNPVFRLRRSPGRHPQRRRQSLARIQRPRLPLHQRRLPGKDGHLGKRSQCLDPRRKARPIAV